MSKAMEVEIQMGRSPEFVWVEFSDWPHAPVGNSEGRDGGGSEGRAGVLVSW